MGFETGNFGNGVKLVYGGEYGFTSTRNYTNFTVIQIGQEIKMPDVILEGEDRIQKDKDKDKG